MQLSFSPVEIPSNHFCNKRLKNMLMAGELSPINKFVSLSSADWTSANNSNNDLAYAYSWGLVSFLMSTEKGQHTLKQFFSGLKNNTGNYEYSATTIENTYPGGIRNLEREWRSWLYSKKLSTFY